MRTRQRVRYRKLNRIGGQEFFFLFFFSIFLKELRSSAFEQVPALSQATRSRRPVLCVGCTRGVLRQNGIPIPRLEKKNTEGRKSSSTGNDAENLRDPKDHPFLSKEAAIE